MQIGKYLEENQPIIYKTFVNAFKNHTLSHAYLLVGSPGTPLYEVAQYLAKSILCDDPSPLACNNCITCMRIDSDNYPDIIKLDGSKAIIKKEDVLNIENRFEKTAFETKGIMIYIVNQVENMRVEAVNSMLKFLEEPESEIYAFLTTNNVNNILPTIVSRCQVLPLISMPRDKVIRDAQGLLVEQDDAELLSYFYNDGELIYDFLMDEEESDNYKEAKKALNGLLDVMSGGNRKDVVYYSQTNIVPLIKTKEELRFFVDLLSQVYEDVLNVQLNREISLKFYEEILRNLSTKLPHVQSSLVEILKTRNVINLNVNIGLLIDHLIINLMKE
jgi:DNA polymerase-3 subunit delta'